MKALGMRSLRMIFWRHTTCFGQLENAGLRVLFWRLVHGSTVLFVFASSICSDGELPIGDPAIWRLTFAFEFLSSWANDFGVDFNSRGSAFVSDCYVPIFLPTAT